MEQWSTKDIPAPSRIIAKEPIGEAGVATKQTPMIHVHITTSRHNLAPNLAPRMIVTE